jgi:aldose 1-epimerase
MTMRIAVLVALLVSPLTLSTLQTLSLSSTPQATQATRSSAAAPYAARSKDGVVQLEDAKHQIVVSILPSVGNAAYEMTVKGTNILRFPYPSLEAFKTKPTRHAGNPFMAPWANRLDELAFYANGKKYPFNMELGNVRGPRPIHGLVTYTSQWKVVEARADARSAWVTSRLEFWREPAWMAQFPFAHAIEMTYRLQDGVLEVATAIENLSTEAMPISIGYHPYFQLSDAPRDAWTVSVGARREWLLAPDKLPTGETRPIEQFFPNPAQVRLGDFDLDHVFDDLVRDANGRAVMSVQGKAQRIDVTFGRNYQAAVLYAPASVKEFICFEPMAAISNAMNLAHRGVYKELQTLAPGQTWRESFWIRPSGF